jgi:hypothetical protein
MRPQKQHCGISTVSLTRPDVRPHRGRRLSRPPETSLCCYLLPLSGGLGCGWLFILAFHLRLAPILRTGPLTNARVSYADIYRQTVAATVRKQNPRALLINLCVSVISTTSILLSSYFRLVTYHYVPDGRYLFWTSLGLLFSWHCANQCEYSTA